MSDAFLKGVLAGYGIAIPVGAIAVMIVDTGVRQGFRNGFAAGMGAASADLLYATLAAGVGTMLAPLIAPAASLIGLLSSVILLYIGVAGLRSIRRETARPATGRLEERSAAGTFARFAVLTLVNPMTVVYFSALVMGTDTSLDSSAIVLFVAGVFLASLSWQTLLATLGATAHARAGPVFRRTTGLVGNILILGFGLTILFRSWP